MISSRICELVRFRFLDFKLNKRKYPISEKDFAKCALGKELAGLINETHGAEVILEPRPATPAPIPFEIQFNFG